MKLARQRQWSVNFTNPLEQSKNAKALGIWSKKVQFSFTYKLCLTLVIHTTRIYIKLLYHKLYVLLYSSEQQSKGTRAAFKSLKTVPTEVIMKASKLSL